MMLSPYIRSLRATHFALNGITVVWKTHGLILGRGLRLYLHASPLHNAWMKLKSE